MIFAGAESARFRSDLRFPVPGTTAVPVCASAAVAGCLYVHEIFSMRDAAACPTDCCPADCCPPAACFLLSAVCRLPPAARRLLPAFCCVTPAARRLSGRLTPLAGSRGGRRCLAFLALRHPHCSRLLPAVPASSCCSRLFRVVPAPPPLPGRGRPEKVTAHPLSGCDADGEYACRYSGSFPVPQRVLGLGPSHSSSRPPRANSSCGNQKLLSTRPFRRARWI